VVTTSRCQSPEKRRRTPKSKNSKGCAAAPARADRRSSATLACSRRRPCGRRRGSTRRKYSSLTVDSTKISKPSRAPAARRLDHQVVAFGPGADEVALEVEQPQEVDEVDLMKRRLAR
jgi:hypothetical protein